MLKNIRITIGDIAIKCCGTLSALKRINYVHSILLLTFLYSITFEDIRLNTFLVHMYCFDCMHHYLFIYACVHVLCGMHANKVVISLNYYLSNFIYLYYYPQSYFQSYDEYTCTTA